MIDQHFQRLFCHALILAAEKSTDETALTRAIEEFSAAARALLTQAEPGGDAAKSDSESAIRERNDVFFMLRMVHGRLRERESLRPELERPLNDVMYTMRWPAPVQSGKYTFSTDWFERAIPDWTAWFADMRGKAGLRFLEIGSFEGRSALWLLDNVLTHPSARLTCLDTFTFSERRFDANITASGAGERIIKIKGASADALPALSPESFDFIYIDADHRAIEVLRDAAAAWPLAKVGALVLFDDYEFPQAWIADEYRDHPSLSLIQTKRGIDSFLTLMSGHYDIFHRGYQLALKKRCSTALDPAM